MRDKGICVIEEPARKFMTNRTRRNRATLRWLVWAGVFVIAFVCGLQAADQGFVLVGAGSSVPLPLYSKWADTYNQNNSNVQLRYMAMGNAEGINQITHGTSDFGAGEIPLTDEQKRAGNLTEVPAV